MKFLAKHGFVQSNFHGCQYGLKSSVARFLGQPILKPWTLASSSKELLKELDRRCTPGPICANGQTHAPCSGHAATESGRYTPEVAKVVHTNFSRLSSHFVGVAENSQKARDMLSSIEQSSSCVAASAAVVIIASFVCTGKGPTALRLSYLSLQPAGSRC